MEKNGFNCSLWLVLVDGFSTAFFKEDWRFSVLKSCNFGTWLPTGLITWKSPGFWFTFFEVICKDLLCKSKFYSSSVSLLISPTVFKFLPTIWLWSYVYVCKAFLEYLLAIDVMFWPYELIWLELDSLILLAWGSYSIRGIEVRGLSIWSALLF